MLRRPVEPAPNNGHSQKNAEGETGKKARHIQGGAPSLSRIGWEFPSPTRYQLIKTLRGG
jgi:hypothetical protein